MRYVETTRLTPTGLGKEGDLLLTASQSLQALALAPTAPHAAWQTCPLRPAPLAGRRLIGRRRLCQDADSYETGRAGSLSTGPTVSAW
jgi:hypothetical protein